MRVRKESLTEAAQPNHAMMTEAASGSGWEDWTLFELWRARRNLRRSFPAARGCWRGFRSRPDDAVRGDLLVQMRTLNLEELCGAADVPVGPLQDAFDVLLLRLTSEVTQGYDRGRIRQLHQSGFGLLTRRDEG